VSYELVQGPCELSVEMGTRLNTQLSRQPCIDLSIEHYGDPYHGSTLELSAEEARKLAAVLCALADTIDPA
jgi:hypothetical protein